MNLKKLQVIGIWNQQKETLRKPQFAQRCIIGSAFIQDLTKNGTEN
jgi:tryptophan synthase alpha chain